MKNKEFRKKFGVTIVKLGLTISICWVPGITKNILPIRSYTQICNSLQLGHPVKRPQTLAYYNLELKKNPKFSKDMAQIIYICHKFIFTHFLATCNY